MTQPPAPETPTPEQLLWDMADTAAWLLHLQAHGTYRRGQAGR